MGQNILVRTGGKGVVDFSRDDSIYTLSLEACVAVGGVQGNSGALVHLTQISDRDRMLDWFYDQIPTEGSDIYLVGGMKGRAEHFVNDLRQRLAARGYQAPSEHVLTENLIDMWLRKEGVELHSYRNFKRPLGMDRVDLGRFTL
tara:strand:- start:52 stop:483 length:432 start_codon:yes stop_codon:yes gene_type:complete